MPQTCTPKSHRCLWDTFEAKVPDEQLHSFVQRMFALLTRCSDESLLADVSVTWSLNGSHITQRMRSSKGAYAYPFITKETLHKKGRREKRRGWYMSMKTTVNAITCTKMWALSSKLSLKYTHFLWKTWSRLLQHAVVIMTKKNGQGEKERNRKYRCARVI